MNGRVLLVDDDQVFRDSLAQAFELEGLQVSAFAQPASVLAHISRDEVAVLVSDVRMPKMDGEQLLTTVRELDPDFPVILLTGHGDVPMAVRSLQNGAMSFHEKPVNAKTVAVDCRRALKHREVVVSSRQLARQLEGRDRLYKQILGSSPAIQNVRQAVSRLGGADSDVLFVGETGVGKEVAARALHSISARSMMPFVPVNCAALDGPDINQQLFGLEDPSGLGAAHVGLFERANNGVLFLDEIESMPIDTQGRLLRVLEERRLKRVEGQTYVPLNVRVIAAAKGALEEAINEGRFRQDLYYRLNTAEIVIPPLRERGADAVVLFEHFLRIDGDQVPAPLTPREMTDILEAKWAGNVREVRSAAARRNMGLPVFSHANTIAEAEPSDLPSQVNAFEKAVLEKAMQLADGDLKQVQERLGLPRKTLADKLAKHGLRG